MKVSTSSYCGECLKDFIDQEIVWFAWIENRSFCSSCKAKLDIQDWEKRVIKKDPRNQRRSNV